LLPALASLLGVAIDRERLAQEAYEAEALRRSDAMKTALLRAVSHDLRSPLMAILTSAGALLHGDLSLDPADRRELGETRTCPHVDALMFALCSHGALAQSTTTD
jgi:two-component system sensor histidine kinase KdpD